MKRSTILKSIDEIPDDAIQVHLYNPSNVLMPRGSMNKESIGLYLLERLKCSYESWTDGKYGDNPHKAELLKNLRENLLSETENAWNAFLESIESEPGIRECIIEALTKH